MLSESFNTGVLVETYAALSRNTSPAVELMATFQHNFDGKKVIFAAMVHFGKRVSAFLFGVIVKPKAAI